jgi:S-adenosylmethionine synthetase
LARKKIAEIGYTDANNGFSADSCSVLIALDEQSPDIAQGVTQAQEQRQAPAMINLTRLAQAIRG